MYTHVYFIFIALSDKKFDIDFKIPIYVTATHY